MGKTFARFNFQEALTRRRLLSYPPSLLMEDARSSSTSHSLSPSSVIEVTMITSLSRTGRGWGISDPKNSNPLEILLQEFRQIDLNTSDQGFVHALWHATNEEERMVLDCVLENMVSQQLLEEESATVVLPHVALVYNDPSIRLDAIANLLDSPSCSNSH